MVKHHSSLDWSRKNIVAGAILLLTAALCVWGASCKIQDQHERMERFARPESTR